ncbi:MULTISPECIES: methyl-accepting chemotaxis protein [unclassified Pseudomonas]|uniref:methyl-accepting chemotaxis protein n=2 Tax=unclassified Pseudomonas TaxID=196821 RepID=UPI000A1EC535|nr:MULTISPECIES: methyl-accepting chemotaxis protein [unclassified Pseudomonas]
MKLANTSRAIQYVLVAIVATFSGLLYTFVTLKQAAHDAREVSERRYQSYLLADELRQSSDDLTRLGRTYVVTANPEYEREYLQILDIRNGKAPRPEDYHRIYWDFVAAGNAQPRPDGEAVALETLMKRDGFTDDEFAKLKEAQANSDKLVQLEVQAMNAVKGKFVDAQGNYTVNGEPDLALARTLVHSPQYHAFKAQIMKPVDEFFGLMEGRTSRAVSQANDALNFAQNLFVAVLLMLIGEIGLMIYLGRKQIIEQLGGAPAELDRVLTEIASGNLAVAIHDAPERSALGSVRVMTRTLRTLIGAITQTSEQLRGAVAQVAQVVEETAARASQQREMTDLVATAVHEMGLTVQEIARNASGAAEASQVAQAEAHQASGIVGESTAHIEKMAEEIGTAGHSVGELAEHVSSIDQVLAVIRGISQQTNLLALNAAIEAARAGESGRGFAVVADEVRTLAGRTQNSTDEIQQMIQGLKQGAETAVSSMRAGQAATQTGVDASQRTNQSLEAIASQIERISDMNSQVATATEEQSSVTEEINRNVQGIADLAHFTSSETHRCQQDCQTLRQVCDELTAQVGNFRL